MKNFHGKSVCVVMSVVAIKTTYIFSHCQLIFGFWQKRQLSRAQFKLHVIVMENTSFISYEHTILLAVEYL